MDLPSAFFSKFPEMRPSSVLLRHVAESFSELPSALNTWKIRLTAQRAGGSVSIVPRRASHGLKSA
jgi:hypothetical protein